MKNVCIIGSLGIDIAIYLAHLCLAMGKTTMLEDHTEGHVLALYMDDNAMAEYMGIRMGTNSSSSETKEDVRIILTDKREGAEKFSHADMILAVTNMDRDKMQRLGNILYSLYVNITLIVKDYIDDILDKNMLIPLLQTENSYVDNIYCIKPDIRNNRSEISLQYGNIVDLQELSSDMSGMLVNLANQICEKKYSMGKMQKKLKDNEKKF